MTGVHRRPAERAVVLVAKAILALAVLALTAVGIYLAIADPVAGLYLVVGLQAAAWILVLGSIVSGLRKPPRSRAQRVRLLGKVLLPMSGTLVLLTAIGQQHGWLHDGVESGLTWTACAFSVAFLVWSLGERRLVALLAARASAQPGQSE
jgi:hypothetical protein